MCDADTFHFGTQAFTNTDRLLRKEFELRNMPINNWEEKTLQLLLSHQYFTAYCNKLLTNGKDENIAVARQLLINKNQ